MFSSPVYVVRAGKDQGAQERDQKVIAPRTLKHTDRIIIEEIGQVSAANFILLSKAVNFNEVQLVMCGDFHQLPPVGHDPVNTHPLWKSLNIKTITLETQYRQIGDGTDEYLEFIGDIKNCIAEGKELNQKAANFLDYQLCNRRPNKKKPVSVLSCRHIIHSVC
jgi:hypothetical protein